MGVSMSSLRSLAPVDVANADPPSHGPVHDPDHDLVCGIYPVLLMFFRCGSPVKKQGKSCHEKSEISPEPDPFGTRGNVYHEERGTHGIQRCPS